MYIVIIDAYNIYRCLLFLQVIPCCRGGSSIYERYREYNEPGAKLHFAIKDVHCGLALREIAFPERLDAGLRRTRRVRASPSRSTVYSSVHFDSPDSTSLAWTLNFPRLFFTLSQQLTKYSVYAVSSTLIITVLSNDAMDR